MERTSCRALQARPARFAAAAFTFVLAALLLLLAANAAHAAVWVIPATARVFPSTAPSASQTTNPAISIDAAQNEYEGAQVVLRGGGDHQVSFSWSTDSDPVITRNTILDRVCYVTVTRPTTGLHARRGRYPDPLVPKSFADQLSVPAETTSFYLLTHVPDSPSAAGDHTATLVVQNGAETVRVPFHLKVWGFGWAQLSTRTGFALNQRALRASVAGSHVKWSVLSPQLLANTYAMLQQHGISSLAPLDLPQPSSSGHIDRGKLAAALAPYLDSGGLDLSATRIPWVPWWPWRVDREYNASSTRLEAYLTDVCAVYKQNGWQDKAYAFILDETTRTARERAAERYARVLHRASARSGYRIKFLLTDDPRPHSLGGVKRANGFLFDDVDIWGVRYYYFFGRVPELGHQKAAGKEIWWYTYANGSVDKIPNFVIEKPNTDQRAWGWLMQRWNVDGLINWALNEWFQAAHPSKWRDPYRDPLSWSTRTRKANGDCSLIYPGYYPAYGLNDPYAAPVSSLRLEALRDGLEDREYLRLAKTLPGGVQFVKSELDTITQFPYPIVQKNVFKFPKYKHGENDAPAYENARYAVAAFIAANQK
jgi:opacity protein-like surface antigen